MTSEAARIEHWDYKLEAWESFRKARPNDVASGHRQTGTSGKTEDGRDAKYRRPA